MKNILLFISTFILSGLLVAGVIWSLGKAGKITYTQEIEPKLETIDAEELIRQLIPDEGKKVGRWEICTQLGNRIKWDSLSMNTNTWKGKCILSFNLPDKVFEDDIKKDSAIVQTLIPFFRAPMKLQEKLMPCEWEVSITGKGSEYFGFSISCNDDCYLWNDIICRAISYMTLSWESKNGDYIEPGRNEIRVQFKGKIPAWFLPTRVSSNFLIPEHTLSWKSMKESAKLSSKLSCRFKSWEE